MIPLVYGSHPSQFAELHLPIGQSPARGWPVCVVVHGGFWRSTYGLELGRPLAQDLADHGIAALNVEYRRVGRQPAGGGWPHTCLDVAAAVDLLVELPEVDLDRAVAMGHSAGGQLVGWLARHSGFRLRGIVAQAGVLDLEKADEDALGGSAVAAFIGGHVRQCSDAYRLASPVRLVPTGIRSVLVHGELDDTVPLSQSDGYARRAIEAGDDSRLIVLPGVDHFDVITPGTSAWAACREAAQALLSG